MANLEFVGCDGYWKLTGNTESLLVTSDQEYRLAALNAALTADILTPPFVLAEILSLQC